MDFNAMSIEELNERRSAIANEVEAPDADLDALEAELRSINEELEKRKSAESKRNEIRAAVASGEGETIKKIEKEERKTMDIKEYRNSTEYIEKYADYLKSGDDTEIRAALLTQNVTDGTIAVPDFVYDIVKTAWDRDDIMSLVRRVELKGNLKVNFEIYGSDAVKHTEGSGAVDEETLTEGIVTLVPAYWKKWKSFSDEVYSMRGEAFVRYIYDEMTHRIIKAMADELVNLIGAMPQTATATAPAAAKITMAPAMGTVAAAYANLSDEANDITIIMNKLTYANFKAVQYANGYGADPFEGFRVRFSKALPAFDAASSGDVYMIVGDLDQGALVNFPNGEGIEFTFDTLTRKKEDLIEVLGKLYAAFGPVSSGAFCLVAKN